MKIEWNRKYTTIAVYTFLTTIAAMLFVLLILNYEQVRDWAVYLVGLIAPILYGVAIAYVLNPILSTVENRILPFLFRKKVLKAKTKRGISIFVTYVFAFVLISVLFWIIIPEVTVSITGIAGKATQYINNLDVLIKQITQQFPTEDLPENFINGISDMIGALINSTYNILTNAVPRILDMTMRFSTGLFNFVLGIIISIYFFLGKETFFAQAKKVLFAFLKPTTVQKVIEITHESHATFSGFISGKILDSFIIGVICFVSMTLLGIPSAMLVSIIVGVTNVIPYFGPFIGAIPSVFIIFIDSPMKSFVFLIFIFVLQQFDGNILGPKILGDSTGLSAIWVIFAIMLFGGLFGVMGMFLGVPTFAVIYSVVRKWIAFKLEQKKMPTATKDYASEKNQLLS